MRLVYSTTASVAQAQFLPVFKQNSIHSFTQGEYIPGKIDQFNYTLVAFIRLIDVPFVLIALL